MTPKIEYWPAHPDDQAAECIADWAWTNTWNLPGKASTLSPYHPELYGSRLEGEVSKRSITIYTRTEGDEQAEINSARADFTAFFA